MKIRYDKEANAAYIYFTENEKATKTVPVNDDVVVDFGTKGKIIGVEVFNASMHIQKKDLKKALLQKIDIPIVKFA